MQVYSAGAHWVAAPLFRGELCLPISAYYAERYAAIWVFRAMPKAGLLWRTISCMIPIIMGPRLNIQPVLERIRNVADEKQADIGGFCSLRKSPPGQNRVDFVIHRILWRRSSAFAGWVNCKDSGFRTDRSRCRPRLFGAELHSAPWPSPPDGSG